MIGGRRGYPALDRSGAQLLALLLVAVVVPSACVLWFMNEAVMNQAAATRQAVVEAYRGQLRLVRGRVGAYWQTRTTELEKTLTGQAPSDFARIVRAGAADAVIVLERDRAVGYPALTERADAGRQVAADAAARNAQQLIREFVRAGDRRGAITLIRREFAAGPATRGVDDEGRLIAADARLLLVNLLPASDRSRSGEITRLIALLNDYDSSPAIPSAQRLFLMNEVRALDGRRPDTLFPTHEAEQLAQAFLESQRPARAGGDLRQTTAAADVWHATSSGGRLVALYRAETVRRATDALLAEHATPDVSFSAIGPGAPSDNEAIAIGSGLPGWEVTFAVKRAGVEAEQARGRRNSYLSIAVLAIGLMIAAIVALGGAARRQARLASLKTDLVSAVSHELKTPAASMRLLVDALLQDAELDPAKTRDYLQLMAVENDRLTRLIDNFLTFSRLERNHYRFVFEPSNPADIVNLALAALPESRRGADAPAIDIAPNLPAIAADTDAMVTVLLNLLDNAYKYSPPHEQVRARVYRDGEFVVFAVDDRGIGIPLREQKRIFRRFYRVDQRLARETAGSGLGLSIVDAIVRAHHGRVRVQSQPERGSTFAVYVPCAAEGTQA